MPGAQRKDARDGLEQRALSAAIRPDHTDHVAWLDLETHVRKHERRVVADGYVVEAERAIGERLLTHRSASAILRAFASNMPSSVAASVPGSPSESP